MYYIYDTCATRARSINRTTSGQTRIHTHTHSLTHTHTHTHTHTLQLQDLCYASPYINIHHLTIYIQNNFWANLYIYIYIHTHTHTKLTRLVLRINLHQNTSTEQLLGKLAYTHLSYASNYIKIHQQNNFWANLHIHTCATHQLTSKYITLQYIHIERLLMMKHQHVSSSSYDMYPAPHMREATHDETSTCILLLI